MVKHSIKAGNRIDNSMSVLGKVMEYREQIMKEATQI
jgi:hypothetical protein